MDAFYNPAIEPKVEGNPMSEDEITLYKEIIGALEISPSEGGKGNNLKPWIAAMQKGGISWNDLDSYRFEGIVDVVKNIHTRLGG